MSTKKKSRRMEPKLVASKDKNESEIKYIASRYKVKIKDVRAARKEVGRSRVKVYAKLRQMGYNIYTRTFRKPPF